MKKAIYLFSIMLICLSINGCTKKEQKQVKGKTYEKFQKDYQNVAENFKMKNFKKTGMARQEIPVLYFRRMTTLKKKRYG